MKYNFFEFNKHLTALVTAENNPVRPCVKLPIDNIILPKWSEMGAFAFMHKYMPMTAEDPDGCAYPMAKFQSVLRIINGHLLFDDDRRSEHGYKRTDNYCWGIEKVQKLMSQGKTQPIGIMSAEGLMTLATVMNTIQDAEEKEVFALMFAGFNKDMLLAHDDRAERLFIRVTQELYDEGWTFTVDEWQEYSMDANGNADTTELRVGDVILVTPCKNGSYTGYRIDKDIFEQTYSY